VFLRGVVVVHSWSVLQCSCGAAECVCVCVRERERDRQTDSKSAETEESRKTVELPFCLFPSDNPNQAPRFVCCGRLQARIHFTATSFCLLCASSECTTSFPISGKENKASAELPLCFLWWLCLFFSFSVSCHCSR
jgi:hypothetical protein